MASESVVRKRLIVPIKCFRRVSGYCALDGSLLLCKKGVTNARDPNLAVNILQFATLYGHGENDEENPSLQTLKPATACRFDPFTTEAEYKKNCG